MRFNLFGILFAATMLVISCKPSATKTPSGYNFKVIENGSGDAAKVNDYVKFTIKITGDDGKVLQEMGEGPTMPVMQIPADMPTGKNANPIMEVLLGSKIGDKIIVTMPIDSMDNAPADVMSLKYIEYEIVVKQILSQEMYEAEQAKVEVERQAKVQTEMAALPAIEELVNTTIADFKSGKLQTKSTASGLKYYVIKEGEGVNAAQGDNVSVKYYGSLMDGKVFDTSYKRGQSFTFALGLGQVIKGWDEGLALLNKGSKAVLFIPAALAYGDQAQGETIPAKSDLVFYVELEDIVAAAQ